MKRSRRSPSTESQAIPPSLATSSSLEEREEQQQQQKQNRKININDDDKDDCFLIHVNNVAMCIPHNEPYINCKLMFGFFNAITHHSPILLLDCTCYNSSSQYAQRQHLEQHLERLLQERKNAIRLEDALRHKRRRAQLRKNAKKQEEEKNSNELFEPAKEEQEQEKFKEVESHESSLSLSDVMNTSSNSSINENNNKNNNNCKGLSVKEYTQQIREIRKAISRLDSENCNGENTSIVSCSSKHVSSNIIDKGNNVTHTENWKMYALPPLPVLLLPSARTGLTRVCANHIYKTVTFVGEKLCGVDGWCQINVSSQRNTQPQPQSQIYYLDEVQKIKAQNEKEVEWAVTEFASLQRFLTKHPDKTITDYFALSPSQMAALHSE